MFTWRQKQDRKKKKGSHTPGKQKANNCQASPFAKFCAKRSRAYKHPDYKKQLEKWNNLMGKVKR